MPGGPRVYEPLAIGGDGKSSDPICWWLIGCTNSSGAGRPEIQERRQIFWRGVRLHMLLSMWMLLGWLTCPLQLGMMKRCTAILGPSAPIMLRKASRVSCSHGRWKTALILEIVSGSVSAIDVTACRLTASAETMKRRVKLRESGISQQEDVSRVAELNAIG